MKERRSVFAISLALFCGLSSVLWAQGLDLGGAGADALQIEADQGLELAQDNRTIIARGNARATRGTVTLTADTLIAHYREAPKKNESGEPASSTEVWRVEALGNVLIRTPTQTITAERGNYNIDDAVVVLTGNNLRLKTEAEEITASDSLEYWEKRQQAVARGNAVAIRGENRLAADILVADIGPDAKNKTGIQRMRAFDNVILTSPKEVVKGDAGDYVVKTGIVTVTGSVRITRDDNQLNGGHAVINLNTGISRLMPGAPNGGEQERVRGLLVPGSAKSDSSESGKGTQ